MTDPFATAPDEPQTAPAGGHDRLGVNDSISETINKIAVPVQSDGEVVLTLKGGSGFDAPWIVVHAPNAQAALGQLDNTMLKLMETAQNAAKHFTSLAPAKAAGGSSNPSAAPQGAQDAPPGSAPAPGPDWTYKTGVGKNGKTWKAWMPPRGSDASPVWL